jgi:hypothetical protein
MEKKLDNGVLVRLNEHKEEDIYSVVAIRHDEVIEIEEFVTKNEAEEYFYSLCEDLNEYADEDFDNMGIDDMDLDDDMDDDY